MHTIEATQAILEELVAELPAALFSGLNGGVSLTERAPLHEQSQPGRPLYVLGAYHRDSLGRYVLLHYGSLRRCFGHLPHDAYVSELRRVLRHELRHHVESLAGEHGLIDFDREQIAAYLTETADLGTPPQG
ncbi:MAG: hypothetical protein QM270_08310 [Bacillota bacterium]|nr:hypothetical protein [Bacillota bacterium]